MVRRRRTTVALWSWIAAWKRQSMTHFSRFRKCRFESCEDRWCFALPPTTIDDGPTGFSQTGVWILRQPEPAAYDGDAREATTSLAPNGTIKTATWSFTVEPGFYLIQATWPAGNNRASNAPYTFLDGSTKVGEAVVSQKFQSFGTTKINGRQFQDLGTAAVAGTKLNVQLSNIGTDGNVIADAINIVRLVPTTRQPIPTLYSTGVEANSASGPNKLVGAGQPDPHYMVTVSPIGAFRPFKTLDDRYPFKGPSAAWYPNGLYSAWISPQKNEDSTNGAPNDRVGSYEYETTCDLRGFDPKTGTITGRVYTDNALAGVYLNGVSTGITAGGFSGSNFTLPSKDLVYGVNTIKFVVINTEGRAANPSGLRVEMSGTALALAPVGTVAKILATVVQSPFAGSPNVQANNGQSGQSASIINGLVATALQNDSNSSLSSLTSLITANAKVMAVSAKKLVAGISDKSYVNEKVLTLLAEDRTRGR